jgi:hypothetical protein
MRRQTCRAAVLEALVGFAAPVWAEDREAARAAVAERMQVAQLLRAVQDQIELDARLEGALVLDGFFVPRDDGGRHLRIRGKFTSEEQPDLLAEVFRRVMEADPYWQAQADDVSIDLRGMPVVSPSGLLAARFYEVGLEYFWRGDYVSAERSFTRAIAEAPAVEAYRYWSIVTVLAMGHEGRAFHKLRPVLRVNPYGSSTWTIARELERVQGPLRWRLHELEKRVLLHEIPGEIPPEPAPDPDAPAEREVRRSEANGWAVAES